ncbi:hypothetical protein Nepgr_021430 [Nepenthes gracilis]|uniref:Uncharacterized protein n=1 Tax=Nepenthes gracilis TaxID=150966 RepID=A0AAD3XX08_NEPGR|nr:hypothetical protein Nepgr_021430 [Nepenthes gracilis]
MLRLQDAGSHFSRSAVILCNCFGVAARFRIILVPSRGLEGGYSQASGGGALDCSEELLSYLLLMLVMAEVADSDAAFVWSIATVAVMASEARAGDEAVFSS